MLAKYAKEHGFTNTEFYVDDGYSGTNFNRPDFQRMMSDVEEGKIRTVIVKDMSRLGRDYLGVGYYTDTFFPEHNIRFIAVNDCVDSDDGENELAPFRNVMNEMYARDISRKVRSAHRIRGNSGEPLGQPPYGYRKDPLNKKHWIIDPAAAQVVRDIFRMCLEGKGNDTIARILQENGILNCTAYWHEKGIGRGGKKTQPNPYRWKNSTIRKILTQQEYCGDVINFKTYSKSFKDKTRIDNPEENWVIFKDVHEPIVDRDTFERVQALLQKKAQKEKKRREKSPLALKIVCGNCGTVFQRRSSQNGYVTWVCRTHDRHAADCPVGRIPEAEIHAAFLRMYHRLKSNADIILAPALRQLNTLDTILRQNHPQVLAINRAIAEATEESHKISTLRANGLLDADICAARMNAISARLAQLRGERRRLTENEAIDETMDALRKVEQTLLNGPERLDGFDEELFEHLVEKIIAESQNRIRFRLYGGLELTEQWEVAAR